MDVDVCGVGVRGPGFDGWDASRRIFADRTPYERTVTTIPTPEILPATERRRSSTAIRIAVAVGQEALHHAGLSGNDVATVFATSDGDGPITHQICDALAQPAREVSPTAFHNSVCNAPAGYWCIGARATTPSTTICAYDLSFAAGLLEASILATVEARPVLFVASDVPFPSPLQTARPMSDAFATALVLAPASNRSSLMRWSVAIESDRDQVITPAPAFVPHSLWANPSTRAIPLLATLAQAVEQRVVLEYVENSVLTVCCLVGIRT
ncbi:hypothetical protein YTPLAS18_15550 [Nitrospira sp.]|nr:hypothetical protein YTPLAS18_15550 [Nitrospira sp.]